MTARAGVRDCVVGLLQRMYRRPSSMPFLTTWQETGAVQILERLECYDGVVLADEVGTGKSYIAAAVAKEYAQQGFVLQFIVPASLIRQWRLLLDRFGLEAQVMSHDWLLRGARYEPVSGKRLLIVDEAHRFRNPGTKRYRALGVHCTGARILLVTATPVCNSEIDLLSLFRLFVADDMFRAEGIYSIERAFIGKRREELEIIIQELLIRRDLETLSVFLSLPHLQRKVIRYEPTTRTAEVAALIRRLEFPLIALPAERELLRRILWRRLESSEAALTDSLRRQRKYYRRALEASRDGCLLTKPEYRRLFGDEDEEAPFQELMFRSFWMAPGSADPGAIHAELSHLNDLLAVLGKGAHSKTDALLAVLRVERVPTLIFTFAVETARHLHESLAGSHRAGLVTAGESRIGADDVRSPEDVFQAFSAGRLDILVATDLASEGLNLQRASRVVHYDLPWNPVKLDQRNGRARRFGNDTHSVTSIYFLPSRSSDRNRIVANVSRKKRICRALLEPSGGGYDPFRLQRWSEEALSRTPDHACCWASWPAAGPSKLLLVSSCAESDSGLTRRRRRLVLFADKSLSFWWRDLEQWIVDTAARQASCVGGSSEIEPTIRYSSRVLRSRELVPPFMNDGAPQLALMRRLEVARKLDDEAAGMLSRRYPAGVEILLRELMKDEHADVSRLRAIIPRHCVRFAIESVSALTDVAFGCSAALARD